MLELYQEYKELYYKELEYRDNLSGKIGTSITFLTALYTGHIFLWDNVLSLQPPLKVGDVLLVIFILVSSFFMLFGTYYFYTTYFRYEYSQVSPKEISRVINFNISMSEIYSETDIDKANRDFLANSFIECTIINRSQNKRKALNQIKFNSTIVRSFAALVMSYLVWLFMVKY